MYRHICTRTACFSRMLSDGDQRSVSAVFFSALVGGAAWQGAMGMHMDERTRALCYFYKHPPPGSDVKPLKYAEIAAIVRKPGQQRLKQTTIRRAVATFNSRRGIRGRKTGWRKTCPAEDKVIMKSFLKVRQPLGARVDARDVYNDLPDALRIKVCLRTVRERLKDKGFIMQDKLTKDDMGEAWRMKRMEFCRKHLSKSPSQWANFVQAVGDFRYFTYYPRNLKKRYLVKSCTQTIMRKGERRNKPAFFRPRKQIFKRSEFKRVTKIKVFGLTTSTGQTLVIPSPLYPVAQDWIKMVRRRVAPFLRNAFPDLRVCRVLLDGERILHTSDTKAAMREEGLATLARWPAHSPDLNPQENVWAWAETELRKHEKKTDSVPTFKRRVAEACKRYPNKTALIPSMAGRVAKCVTRRGTNIGK